MKESNLHREIQIAASARGHRLFRMNVGLAYVGLVINKTAERITLSNWRPMKVGVVGMSDLVGFTREGRYAALEVKIGRNKPSPEQIAFIEAVRAAGGIGAVVWSVDEAMTALDG